MRDIKIPITTLVAHGNQEIWLQVENEVMDILS